MRELRLPKACVQQNKNQMFFVPSECALGKFNRLMRTSEDAGSVKVFAPFARRGLVLNDTQSDYSVI